MLLYNSQVSGNCYKVRLLFAHLGHAYERHEVDVIDRSDRPELLGQLNPVLRVPTLVLDDGRVMAESNAIPSTSPTARTTCPTTRGNARRCSAGCSSSSTTTSPTSPSRGSGASPSRSRPPRSCEARRRAERRHCSAMEAHLTDHEFFVGDRYTIADIALYGYTHVAPEGGFELDAYPAINTWLTRVRRQPGHVAITLTRGRRQAAEYRSGPWSSRRPSAAAARTRRSPTSRSHGRCSTSCSSSGAGRRTTT